MRKDISKNKKQVDFILLISTIALTLIGVLMVYSASSPEATLRFKDGAFYVRRHVTWATLGSLFMFISMNINYHIYKKLAPLIYITSLIIGSLIFTPLAIELKGAVRWINVGFSTLMPSDILKISSVIFMATFLDGKRNHIKSIKRGTLPAIIIILLPVSLIYIQPDLSTALTLTLTLLAMYFIGGMHLGWFLVIPPAGIYLVYKAVMSEGNEYRMRRVLAFMDPFADKLGSGWQVVQSLYALGSGGIYGVGPGRSIQKHFYISESYNDFIFAIIGEEFGLVGTSFILILYGIIIWKGIEVAINAKDLFGTYLATGITALFAIQTFINIGTVTSTIPATGITLPLISFGGTSLVMYLVSLGILLNISKHQK